MTLFELMAKISIDSSQYEKGIKDANKSAKGAQEQNETLVNKIKVLQSQYQTAGKRVEELTKKFNESVSKTGAASDETQELAKELEKAEREAEDARKALDKYNDEVDQTDKKTSKATGSLSKFASGLGKGLAGAAKIGAKAIAGMAAGIAAAGTALVAAAESTREYRNEMAKLNTAFTQNGKSAETAYNVYSDLQGVLGETEQAAEAANHLAKLSLNEKELSKLTQSLTGVYANFGVSLPLEGLTEAINHTAKLGEVQGPLADALEWSGIAADDFNAELEKCTNEQERQELIVSTLNKLYGKSGEAYRENNKAIIEANKATEKWNASLAKIGGAIEPLITMVKTLAADALGQLAPMVENVAKAFQEGIPQGAQAFGDMLGGLVNSIVEYAPKVVKTAVTLVNSLIKGLSDNQKSIAKGAVEIVATLANGILSMLPQIIQLGLDLIVSLANGIAENLPTLIPAIMGVIMQIVHILTDPANLTNLLTAALTIIKELAYGLMDAIPQLVNAINQIVMNIGWFLTDPKNIEMLLNAALQIVIALGTGILNAIPVFLENMVTFYAKIFDNFKSVDWGQLGKNLVEGFKNGISKAWTNLKKWFKDLFGDLTGIAKKILGIASPSKVFAKLGGFTAEGFGVGFEDEFAHVKDDMEDALNFNDASVGINASIRKVGAGAAGSTFGGTSIGNININIDGAKYSDEQSLASAIALEIQNMTDRRAAVYA